jgi:hypothetical protein
MQRLSLRAGFLKVQSQKGSYGMSLFLVYTLFYVLWKSRAGGGEVSGGGTHYM